MRVGVATERHPFSESGCILSLCVYTGGGGRSCGACSIIAHRCFYPVFSVLFRCCWREGVIFGFWWDEDVPTVCRQIWRRMRLHSRVRCMRAGALLEDCWLCVLKMEDMPVLGSRQCQSWYFMLYVIYFLSSESTCWVTWGQCLALMYSPGLPGQASPLGNRVLYLVVPTCQ